MIGKMAEWSIASDLKSDVLNGTVSSNLTLSFLFFSNVDYSCKIIGSRIIILII